jgi:O-acetylserine/cysteine efflux transporter
LNGRLQVSDLAAVLVVVVWGVNFCRPVEVCPPRDFTPFQLGAARYVFAVLLPLMLFIKPPRLRAKVAADVWPVSRALDGLAFCSLRSK